MRTNTASCSERSALAKQRFTRQCQPFRRGRPRRAAPHPPAQPSAPHRTTRHPAQRLDPAYHRLALPCQRYDAHAHATTFDFNRGEGRRVHARTPGRRLRHQPVSTMMPGGKDDFNPTPDVSPPAHHVGTRCAAPGRACACATPRLKRPPAQHRACAGTSLLQPETRAPALRLASGGWRLAAYCLLLLLCTPPLSRVRLS